jgi:hypothetical protein
MGQADVGQGPGQAIDTGRPVGRGVRHWIHGMGHVVARIRGVTGVSRGRSEAGPGRT